MSQINMSGRRVAAFRNAPAKAALKCGDLVMYDAGTFTPHDGTAKLAMSAALSYPHELGDAIAAADTVTSMEFHLGQSHAAFYTGSLVVGDEVEILAGKVKKLASGTRYATVSVVKPTYVILQK